MENQINITKRIGDYIVERDNTLGRYEGPLVLPCSEYVTKDTGDRPLYEALLMAAREVMPYMVPTGVASKEEYTIAELAKEKAAPLKVDTRKVPDEMLHLRFIIGTSVYESGVQRLVFVLDGIRKIVRAGNRDKLTFATYVPQSLCESNPQPSFADLLRKALQAA